MFNSISGILTEKTADMLYVDTYGIEWEIAVSALDAGRFGAVGSKVKVYVWLYHREDAMRLYGFSDPRERALFWDLTKVDGIGPKQALRILSGLDSKALETALEAGDIAQLQTIPGIGKKTAQKMVLALKGQLTLVSESKQQSPQPSPFEDIIAALTAMGYERKRAAEAVTAIAETMRQSGSDPAAKEQELFRSAIINLSAQ